MTFIDALGGILNNAYILFCVALGLWAAWLYIQNKPLGGDYWGAVVVCTVLAAAGLVVWLIRTLAGEPLRWVYFLYAMFFVVVLPGTFSILRGRDDRNAAGIFAGVAIFAALSAIAAADPSRAIIVIPNLLPTVTPIR